MGWSWRKSIKLGPFNLNLSKGGVGVSTGVRGARVSVGPRGTNVSAGRGGIRYTKSLGRKGKAGLGAGLVGLVGLIVYLLQQSGVFGGK